jgi:hypothetical protein
MSVLVGAILIVLYSLDTGIGGGRGTAKDKKHPTLGEPPKILLSMVTTEAAVYDANGRDLFKFGQPPRVATKAPPKRAAPPPTKKPADVKKPVKRPPARAAAKPPEPRPPEIRFKYIGYLGPKGDKIAVFADGDDMLLAREGEVVKEQFKVLDFKYESILMGYTDPLFESKTTEVSQEQ